MKASRFLGRHAVWAVPAAVALGIATAGAAAPARATGPEDTLTKGAASSPGACQPGELRASLPATIPGDPGAGASQVNWNILLRNVGNGPCSVQGWPRLQVQGTPVGAASLAVRNNRFNNLDSLPARTVKLLPGDTAVVTATSHLSDSKCVVPSSLTLGLAGSTEPISIRLPASPPGECLSGPVQLSPFYARQTLTRQIKALSAGGQPAFPVVTGKQPLRCKASELQAHVASVTSGRRGTIAMLSLGATRPCSLYAGAWPTLRLYTSDGANPVAKALPYTPVWSGSETPITLYRGSTGERAFIPLRPGKSVSIALLSANGAPQTCTRVKSVAFYPSPAAVGSGTNISFGQRVRVCGQPSVLPFLSGAPLGRAQSVARDALASATRITLTHDTPTGFWYGSDGWKKMVCGSGPYKIKGTAGDCSSTEGNYGAYLGEVGKWDRWKGCSHSTSRAWNSTNFDDAQTNVTTYSKGVGNAVYWMMGGPGRDSDYTSTSAAYTWGKDQATRVVSDISSMTLLFPYVFMDIEQYTSGYYMNGWNEAWSSICSTSKIASSISSTVDRNDFNGFFDYINNNTPYRPGVYSSGGSSSYEWTGIFGSNTLNNTSEWTYNQETSSFSTYPSGFSVNGFSASWFASVPTSCELLWQWTGGSVSNSTSGYRVDQIDGNRNGSCN